MLQFQIMKPLMTGSEIKYIETTLLSYGRRGKRVRVLEWGSGGSTVYFTAFMRSHNVDYLWRSIEYNRGWYEKVKDALSLDTKVLLELFDVGNNVLRQRNIPMDEYVAYPSTLDELFDVIIVDGRKRRRCVLLAKELLDKNGVVFLHDAQRKHYQCAFSAYPDHTFQGVHLWRGKNEEIGLIKKFRNSVRSLFFKIVFICITHPIQFVVSHLVLKHHLTKEILSCGSTRPTKMKMFFIIMMLALKKKNIPVLNFVMTLDLKKRGSVLINLRDYQNAVEFGEAIMKPA